VTTTEPARERTYSWGDPGVSATAARTSAGIDVLRALARGELPAAPVVSTLGFVLDSVEPGHVQFSFEPAEFHYNPIGVVHAGLAMTLLDSAMGCAFVSTIEAGVAWTTLELKANFTRALTMDTGTVRCTGTMVHPGRTVATTEARIEDARGRLCAHGTSTILVVGAASR
jgi:uncharacterized protein (TIGR00369 family)